MRKEQRIFNQVKGYLQDIGSYQSVDDPVIRIYADGVANWERLTNEIEEEGHQVQDRDDLPRKNPKLMAQRQYAELIAKYAQLLGISTYGRKKSQIVKTEKKPVTKASMLRPLDRSKRGKFN
jgi:P27 family predicted phage terminase small subunit